MTNAPARILVIGDNPVLLRAVTRALDQAGYQVETAANGHQGLELVESWCPDLVLLDVVLPDINGIEICRRIKEDSQKSNVYVILLSGLKTDSESQAIGVEAGADGYLTRPVSNRELRARVESILSLKSTREALQNALAKAQQNEHEKHWLLRASQAVMKYHTFPEAARKIFDIAREATKAVSGYVALMSKDGAENEVLFLESGGLPCKVDPELPMPIRGLRADSYTQKAVVYENDFEHSEWVQFMPSGHVIMRNVLFAPLLIDDQAVGVIGLANKPANFTEDDAKIAKALGDMAAIALRRIRAEEGLINYSNQLEKMVEKRTQALQEAQEQLIRKERLAAIGEFTGGIVHDLRHPLSVIANVVYLLNSTITDPDEETVEYLAMLTEEVNHAKNIITNLLEFARTGEAKPTSAPIDKLVEMVFEKHPPPDGVITEINLSDDLPPVYIDLGHIKQVLTNLIENGYDAMAEGGKLSVNGKRYKGNRIQITIRDTGTGIPPENLEKIFEPLFTTKQKGIGLGLAITKTLVEANDGRIEVESENNVGTTFRIFLPMAKETDKR